MLNEKFLKKFIVTKINIQYLKLLSPRGILENCNISPALTLKRIKFEK